MASTAEINRPPGAQQGHRPRRKVDWELISCGFRGHELVGTDARHIRAQDRLLVREEDSFRWYRCLRCDSWVGLPTSADPQREFPSDRDSIVVPLRGKALRDRFVLRLIAVDRAIHFVILFALGIAVLVIAAHESSLRSTFYTILSDLQRGVGGGPVQAKPHGGFLGEVVKLFSIRSGKLHTVALALLAYGALEGTEAVGLWFAKRWAEYLTFVATAILLPLEIYEIAGGASVLKVVGFLLNLAVVVYLLLSKRLFGLRGGGAADEALRTRDMSWEALERVTPPWHEVAGVASQADPAAPEGDRETPSDGGREAASDEGQAASV